jgi:hypothetical protein
MREVISMLKQATLFDSDLDSEAAREATSSTFVDNLRLPVHRWIRYSVGFSAEWARSVIQEAGTRSTARVFDPFAGSGTTLLAAEQLGVESCGVEAHPFVARMAEAKLAWRSEPEACRRLTKQIKAIAADADAALEEYPKLIRECFDDETLTALDRLRRAVVQLDDGSPSAKLAWLALTAILRKCSHAGTAQWQYVLPKKSKSVPQTPDLAFESQCRMMHRDMLDFADRNGPASRLIRGDARTCDGIPNGFVNLVVTSPPYPNNFDYADATRLEMSFYRELQSWGELQSKVRCHLLRSCSQHVPERTVELTEVLADPLLEPIRIEITDICKQLAEVRLTKGGKKTYHLMVACYFLDLSRVWLALRRVCASPCDVCFVIGDSAPYGVYVPVIDWLGRLALAAGFKNFRFERTRDRNVKWKNRKHRVPLCEGRLWVQG